jgi:hypothetical protein
MYKICTFDCFILWFSIVAQVNEQNQDTTKNWLFYRKVQIKILKVSCQLIRMTRLPTDIFIPIQLMVFH